MKPIYGYTDLKKLLTKETELGPWQKIHLARGTLFHEIIVDELCQIKPGEIGHNPHKVTVGEDEGDLDYSVAMEVRDSATAYAKAISQHPYFTEAIRVEYEKVCFHEYLDFTGRASIDMVLHYPHGAVQLWDFKTTSTGFRGIGSDIHHIKRYHYDLQMAFYLDVYEKVTHKEVNKYCLAFCNTLADKVRGFSPYEFDPDSNVMSGGAQRMEKAIQIIRSQS